MLGEILSLFSGTGEKQGLVLGKPVHPTPELPVQFHKQKPFLASGVVSANPSPVLASFPEAWLTTQRTAGLWVPL